MSPTWAVMLDGVKVKIPGPPTIILWSLLDGVEVPGVGAGVDVDKTEVGREEVAPPVAAAWKAARSLPGLTEKIIPALQWVPWRQYAHRGPVRSTVRLACGKSLVLASATAMNPESKPPCIRTHGAAKVD